MAGEKILIVDDEKDIQDLIKSYVLREGFIPICAENGSSALEKIANDKPDLIILDFMLPNIEGQSYAYLFAKKRMPQCFFYHADRRKLTRLFLYPQEEMII